MILPFHLALQGGGRRAVAPQERRRGGGKCSPRAPNSKTAPPAIFGAQRSPCSEKSNAVPATHPRPSFATPVPKIASKQKKGRRSADRRTIHWPRHTLRRCHPKMRGRGSGLIGGRSPLGAPPRLLSQRPNALTQPRPRFAPTRGRRHYPRRHSRLSEAPRAPVLMPEGTIPGPPGSRVTSPARRNRTRSIVRLSPATSLRLARRCLSNLIRDQCQDNVTETGTACISVAQRNIVSRFDGGVGCPCVFVLVRLRWTDQADTPQR